MSKTRKVEITGTFALCVWLFMILHELGHITNELKLTREQLQKPIQIVVVEPNEPDVNEITTRTLWE